ncbi:MAG TPA: sugar phosphate isomerase/epimerase [Balneolales bacterium]|nr:sugar phosphate isomerase/epimerase [Balneolales bacterium]
MKNFIHTTLAILFLVTLSSCGAKKKETPAKLGWKIGVQAYTFRDFTFFQAVKKVKNLGLHYIEAWPGQKIGGGIDGKMAYTMSATKKEKIRDFLNKNGVHMMAYGVLTPKTEKEWKQIFDFARDMGVKNITAEPLRNQMSYVSHLCDMYGINVAIHNHPQPSQYWNPDTLLDAIQGQGPHIGACADIGHWVRSGLNPLKSIKKLNGHIIQLHFKDVTSTRPQAKDTVWGDGVIDIPGILQELKKQNFKGLISIEYESNPKNNVPDIKKSLQYFDKQVAKL